MAEREGDARSTECLNMLNMALIFPCHFFCHGAETMKKKRNNHIDFDNCRRYLTTKSMSADGINEAARQITRARFERLFGPLDWSRSVRECLALEFTRDQREVFAISFLDQHHRVITFERLCCGTADGASVRPRDVVKRALELNAAAVILAHNHPSGEAIPSEQDRKITNRLKEALCLVGVRLLDHFIAAGDDVISMAELEMV
jgi:DNA repair protein RadC